MMRARLKYPVHDSRAWREWGYRCFLTGVVVGAILATVGALLGWVIAACY